MACHSNSEKGKDRDLNCQGKRRKEEERSKQDKQKSRDGSRR